MFYQFSGNPLYSEYMVTDQNLIYGETSYPLTALVKVTQLYKPSATRAGMVEATFGEKRVMLTYSFKEAPMMNSLFPELMKIAQANGGLAFGTKKKSRGDLAKKLFESFDPRQRLLYPDVDEEDFGIAVDELFGDEPVILAAVSNVKCRERKIDGGYAVIFTDERFLVSQKRSYSSSLYTVWYDELNRVSYHDTMLQGTISVVTETERWQFRVDNVVLAEKINEMLTKEAAKNEYYE